MRKFGYFCLSFLPLVIAIAIEYIAAFFMMGLSAVFAGLSSSNSMYAGSKLFDLWMDNDFNMVIMIIFALMCICTFGLIYYHRCGGDFLPDPKTTFHPLIFAAIVILVPGTQYAASLLSGILGEIFPSWMEAYEQLFETAGLTGAPGFLVICYSVILAPISEELIFRGVTLRWAEVALPFWLANILQAVLFGVFHGNMLQGCYAAALALVLGYICKKGGSIYFSILLHMLFNFWGTVVSEYLYFENLSDEIYSLLILVVMVVSLAVGFPLFYVGCQKRPAVTEKWTRPSSLPPS